MTNWFPKDFELEQNGGNYSRLNAGDNTFRVLSPSVIGWKYFNKQSKPVWVRDKNEVNYDDIGEGKFGPQYPKQFFAVIVRDYQLKKITVLEVTQKAVIGAIHNLVKKEDYNDLTKYDLIITKTGDGLETKYSILPGKEKATPKEAQEQWAKKKDQIHLTNFFANGADPFGPYVTPPTLPLSTKDDEYF